MEKTPLEIGDLVQLSPDHAKFPGQMVAVTEPKDWGCQGVLWTERDLGDSVCRFKGRGFVRPKFEDFEYVGKLVWMFEDEEEEDEE